MENLQKVNVDRIENETTEEFEDYLIGETEINGIKAQIILTDLNSGDPNDPWYNVGYRYNDNEEPKDFFSTNDPFKIIEDGYANIRDFAYFTESLDEAEMNNVVEIVKNAVK